MNDKATNGLDYGYDSILFDEQQNDMYFTNSNSKLTIQGEGYFNSNNIYPITVKTSITGNVKFMLDGLENFDSTQPIYIHNNTTDSYHDLRNGIYEINLTAGTYETQFSLRFNQTTLSNEDVVVNGLNTMFIQNNNTIAIKNELLNLFIEKVHLYNLLGQIIKTWDVSNYDQTNISIPVEFISTGTYIVKIQTTNGNFSKKIIKN